MAYDDANSTVRREWWAGEAGGAATTEYLKYRSFQKARLKKVHAIVTTAGTATGHALDVYHGTDSIGSITLGTSTAGATASSALLDHTIDSLTQISVKTKADATGKANIIYEYEVLPDAVKS